MTELTRRRLLAATGATGALVGCLGIGGDGGSTGARGSDSGSGTDDGDGGGSGTGDGGGDETDGRATWRTTTLTDVRNGETFTVDDLEKPVLLQTFAVWCSKCLRQQRNVRALTERAVDVRPVNLNIDPNEDEGRVRSHLQEHGFDWRYAVSPQSVTDSLVDRFGSSITVPPQSPVVVVCENETTRLSDGIKAADQLERALDRCQST